MFGGGGKAKWLEMLLTSFRDLSDLLPIARLSSLTTSSSLLTGSPTSKMSGKAFLRPVLPVDEKSVKVVATSAIPLDFSSL